jgi:hypothetical protein
MPEAVPWEHASTRGQPAPGALAPRPEYKGGVCTLVRPPSRGSITPMLPPHAPLSSSELQQQQQHGPGPPPGPRNPQGEGGPGCGAGGGARWRGGTTRKNPCPHPSLPASLSASLSLSLHASSLCPPLLCSSPMEQVPCRKSPGRTRRRDSGTSPAKPDLKLVLQVIIRLP